MNTDPKLEARIARLEQVLGTLISWLVRELGTEAAAKLLSDLDAKP